MKCDKCGKMKSKNELTLMLEGAGIRFSKNSRVIEAKIRNWVELYSDRKISFPYLCTECQRDPYFRQIMSGKFQ